MAKKESKQIKFKINYTIVAMVLILIGAGAFYMLKGNSNGIKSGDTVDVDYILRVDNGKVIDTSIESVARSNNLYTASRDYSPLKFKVGEGQLIPGFEKGVIGMQVGETKTVVVDPRDGYGEYSAELVITSPISKIQADNQTLQIGGTVYTSSGEPGIIKSISGEDVTIDFNSPLAGQVLTFEITVV